MKTLFDTKYQEHKDSLAEAAKRRAKRNKPKSSMTTDDSREEDGNSRLSSIKKVTSY